MKFTSVCKIVLTLLALIVISVLVIRAQTPPASPACGPT